MFFALDGVMNVSLRCHDVRCGSAPSVSQLAFPGAGACPCARGAPVQTTAAHNATAAPIDLRVTDGLLPSEDRGPRIETAWCAVVGPRCSVFGLRSLHLSRRQRPIG